MDRRQLSGLRAVFSWSYRSLSDAAARLFRLMGLPTVPDISLAAAADLAGVPQRQARTLLAELVRANLVEQPATGRYRFHDLLRAYAAECAASDEDDADRDAALRRLFDHYLRTSFSIQQRLVGHSRKFTPDFPSSDVTGLSFDDDEAALQWWEDERPNLVAAVKQANQLTLHQHAWQIPNTVAYFFRLRGYLDDWITTHEIGLSSARELGDREGEAHLLLGIGTAYYRRKQYDLTAENQERALSLFEELGDQYWTGVLLAALGEVYPLLQQYDKAAASLNRSLEIQRASGDLFGQGVAHAALGLLHSEMRQFDQTFTHLNEALRLYREAGEDVGEGFVLHFLADAHLASGQLGEAAATYREAVAHRNKIGNTQGEAESLRRLGAALRDSGDISGAKAAWQQAITIFETLGQPDAGEIREDLETLG